MNCVATEFVRETMAPTGTTEIYTGDTIQDCVANCLYTRRLANKRAFIGPTGRVVYSHGFAYTITPEK